MECTKCKHCNIAKYNSGKWYCNSPKVSIFDIPPDKSKCYEGKEEATQIFRNGKSSSGHL